MRQNIKFAKMNVNAIIPSKRDEDAGFDIYACFEADHLVIEPHTIEKIPTGIASAFEPTHVAKLEERGSTGTVGMAVRAGIMDSGYRGQWIVPICNVTDHPIIIAKESYLEKTEVVEGTIIHPYGKAIAQALMIRLDQFDTEELSYEELLLIESERGDGKLGSSGK